MSTHSPEKRPAPRYEKSRFDFSVYTCKLKAERHSSTADHSQQTSHYAKRIPGGQASKQKAGLMHIRGVTSAVSFHCWLAICAINPK